MWGLKCHKSENKLWKTINREKKLLKEKHKQENLLRKPDKAKKLEELAKVVQDEEESIRKPISTVNIAVPSSILENAQSAALRTYLDGQIARSACIFRIDEVIVFDDVDIWDAKQAKRIAVDEGETGDVGRSLQLARILQYLECPQYLRKFFFPLHSASFKTAKRFHVS